MQCVCIYIPQLSQDEIGLKQFWLFLKIRLYTPVTENNHTHTHTERHTHTHTHSHTLTHTLYHVHVYTHVYYTLYYSILMYRYIH